MFKQLASIVVVSSAMAGCSASFDPQLGKSDTSSDERTQLAAYAASTEYPATTQPTDDLRAGAVVDRDNSTIQIQNFSNRSLQNTNVWVNGAYVKQVASIPPRGSYTLHKSEFFDNSGRTLADQNTSVTQVQLQDGDRLYDLQGPIAK